MESAGAHVAPDNFLESWLVNGNLTGIEPRNLCLVDINACDVVTEVGQARACHQAHISGADYADIRQLTPSLLRSVSAPRAEIQTQRTLPDTSSGREPSIGMPRSS